MQTNPLEVDRARQQVTQYLTFLLGGQRYAVPILAVQEIRRYSTPTALPAVPSYVLGVINLRGTVVPVIDLRLRFARGDASVDRLTVVIVVSVMTRHVGLVVDDVSRVLTTSLDDVQPAPQFANHVDVSFVAGLLRDAETLVTILDIGKLVGDELGLAR